MKNYKNNVGAGASACPSSKARQNRGITLIALVITIIVMLILVAVTISMAINGGLFQKAGEAVGDTQNRIDEEQELADGRVQIDGKWYASIDDYLAGKYEGYVPIYAEANFENGVLTENATYTSGDYTAIIPKGFAIVPGLNGTTTIADGLVIADELDENGNSIGNEFVWIPVEVTETDTETSIASFYRSNWSSNTRGTTIYTDTSGSSYNEPYASGYSEEAAEYNEMLKSVYENKGFYIGRYEAGSTTSRALYESSDTTITDEQRTSEMVIKRDAYPYNYVGWGATMTDYTSDVLYTSGSTEYNQGKGALYLSKALYSNKDVGVTSTLCYGIQWDAMLDFIKNDDHNVTSSSSWGNHLDSAYTITRQTAQYYDTTNKEWAAIPEAGLSNTTAYSDSYLLTTGASDSFAAKNIFDVAGNVFEWTNEANSSTSRVVRGGGYNAPSSVCPASYRSYNGPYNCLSNGSFRPVLYIK